MEKPEHHIFVCASFRADGDGKGVCKKKGSMDLLPYIENEILDRGPKCPDYQHWLHEGL